MEYRKNFSSYLRLLRRSEFLYISRMGCKIITPHFIIYYVNNNKTYSRLGLTVSKKIGNAVLRNRIKRYLRDFFRNNKNLFEDSKDFSIIARKNIIFISHENLNFALSSVLKNEFSKCR